jgi:hypothetical protein
MKILVTEYVHKSGDEFADWEVEHNEKGNYDMYGEAGTKLHYRLYEMAVTMEIDLETGDYDIVAIDGRKLLPAKETT